MRLLVFSFERIILIRPDEVNKIALFDNSITLIFNFSIQKKIISSITLSCITYSKINAK